MKVEAVFFDMGGTLAYGTPDAWKVFIDVCREHGVRVTLEDISKCKAKVDPLFRSRQFLTRERLEIYPIKRYALLLDCLGAGDEAVTIAEEVQAFMNENGRVMLYDDVPNVLADLRGRGLYMGILSNTACTLEAGCKKLGVWECFDIIIASDLILSSKPKPLMFHLAASEAGVAPGACLHVGDSYSADYLGARAVGMQALLLDRAQSSHEDCPKIKDLNGVVEFIDRGSGRPSPE